MNQFRIIETYFGYQSARVFSDPDLHYETYYSLSLEKQPLLTAKTTHCFQPIPQKIRTNVSQKGTIWKGHAIFQLLRGWNMLDEKKKWHSTKPSPFPNGLFFPPETNIAPGPQAFPKGSWIIFQPQGFFFKCYSILVSGSDIPSFFGECSRSQFHFP